MASSDNITSPSPDQPKLTVGRAKAFAALTGVTALAVLLQAITAGEFVSQEHRHFWIVIHDGVANATCAIALITALFAVLVLRRSAPMLAWLSTALFVLIIGQTLIGHQITDNDADGWIAVHVPLAFIVFGLTVWLSLRAAALRRSATAN